MNNSDAASPPTPVFLEDGNNYDESEHRRSSINSRTSKNNVGSTIFSCNAKYHWFMILALSIVPLVSVASVIVIPVCMDPASSLYHKKWIVTYIAGFSLGFAVVLYMTTLPLRWEVRVHDDDDDDENVSVVLVTFLHSHVCSHVVRAYQLDGFFGSESKLLRRRPFVKFVTDFGPRIVVERQAPGWDLVLTPSNPSGFLQAVHDATTGVMGLSASLKKSLT